MEGILRRLWMLIFLFPLRGLAQSCCPGPIWVQVCGTQCDIGGNYGIFYVGTDPEGVIANQGPCGVYCTPVGCNTCLYYYNVLVAYCCGSADRGRHAEAERRLNDGRCSRRLLQSRGCVDAYDPIGLEAV